MDNGLVEVSLHGGGLVLDELAVGGGGLGNVVHDTGHTLEVTLGALAVGGDDVGEHGDLGRELTLGTLEGVGRGQGSGSGGTTEGGAVALVALLLVGHALVEGTGSLGKVLGHLTTVAGVAATSLGELILQGSGEGSNLSRGGGLVLVHEEFELATGTLGGRVAAVGDTHDTLELSGHTTVDTHLVGLVGDNLTGDDSDLTDETSLDVLHLSGHSGHLGGEVLAELTHLVGGLVAGSVEVLDGLGEAGVSEGSLLGEGIVEAGDGGTELLVEAGTLGSEVLIGLAELLLGLLLGDLQLGSGKLEGSLLAGGVTGGELAESSGGTDLGDGGGREGLDLTTGLLGLGTHAGGVGVDTSVGLLDGLGGLGLKGEAGTGIGGDGVTDHAGHGLRVGGDAGSKGLAREGGMGMGLSGTLLEGLHLVDTVTDGNLEVTLGDISGRADSVEHLLLHLGTGLLGLKGEGLDGGVGLVTELGDLSVELVVHQPAGVLVHLGATLLDKLGTLLTTGDSTTDGVVELVLVGILEGSNGLAATGRLGGVRFDD